MVPCCVDRIIRFADWLCDGTDMSNEVLGSVYFFLSVVLNAKDTCQNCFLLDLSCNNGMIHQKVLHLMHVHTFCVQYLFFLIHLVDFEEMYNPIG